ncbi:hypothetical protein T484DRAFT_2228103 [Baffinella frigidus]|nr:hypothetical protein T484DRAFT_2228103 [Cryptophyta sp. CCMP2293]
MSCWRRGLPQLGGEHAGGGGYCCRSRLPVLQALLGIPGSPVRIKVRKTGAPGDPAGKLVEVALDRGSPAHFLQQTRQRQLELELRAREEEIASLRKAIHQADPEAPRNELASLRNNLEDSRRTNERLEARVQLVTEREVAARQRRDQLEREVTRRDGEHAAVEVRQGLERDEARRQRERDVEDAARLTRLALARGQAMAVEMAGLQESLAEAVGLNQGLMDSEASLKEKLLESETRCTQEVLAAWASLSDGLLDADARLAGGLLDSEARFKDGMLDAETRLKEGLLAAGAEAEQQRTARLDAEHRCKVAEKLLKNAEKRLGDAEQLWNDAEKRLGNIEQRWTDSEQRCKDTEQRCKEEMVHWKREQHRGLTSLLSDAHNALGQLAEIRTETTTQHATALIAARRARATLLPEFPGLRAPPSSPVLQGAAAAGNSLLPPGDSFLLNQSLEGVPGGGGHCPRGNGSGGLDESSAGARGGRDVVQSSDGIQPRVRSESGTLAEQRVAGFLSPKRSVWERVDDARFTSLLLSAAPPPEQPPLPPGVPPVEAHAPPLPDAHRLSSQRGTPGALPLPDAAPQPPGSSLLPDAHRLPAGRGAAGSVPPGRDVAGGVITGSHVPGGGISGGGITGRDVAGGGGDTRSNVSPPQDASGASDAGVGDGAGGEAGGKDDVGAHAINFLGCVSPKVDVQLFRVRFPKS